MDVRYYRIMHNHFLWRRFFYGGVGVLSSLVLAPLYADAGVVDVVKEFLIKKTPTTIIIDRPSVAPEVAALEDAVRETVEQVIFHDPFTSRAMIDVDATDAAWNEQEGGFTIVDETGAWMRANGKDNGEDLIARGTGMRDVALVYDRDGKPVAVWTDSSAHLFVSRWHDGVWRGFGADASWDEIAAHAMACDEGVVCHVASPQVMMDGDNLPVIAWAGVRNNEQAVFAVRWSGQLWQAVSGNDTADRLFATQSTAEAQGSAHVQIMRDGAGRPAIAATYGDGAGVFFAQWNGMQWTAANGTAGNDTLFADDAQARMRDLFVSYDVHASAPSLAAFAQDGTVKQVLWRDGQWFIMPEIAFSAEEGVTLRDASVAYTAEHVPLVATIVQKVDGVTELQMHSWEEERWHVYTTPLMHGEDRVRVDVADAQMPLVVCYGTGVQKSSVTVGVWTGVEIITMDGTAPGMDEIVAVRRGGVQHIAVVRDADRTPSVAWTENGNLYTTRWNGMQWAAMDRLSSDRERVATGGVRAFVFAATPDGDPSLLWTQEQQREDRLQYTFVPTVVESPRTVQSHDVSGGATGIAGAILTADADVPEGARITYAVSVDGGATWERAHRGKEVVLSQPSQGIRWRAQLHDGDAHRMPTLYDVRIIYHVRHAVQQGVCGAAAREYAADALTLDGALCAEGVADEVSQFSAAGEMVQWQCRGVAQTAMCTATRIQQSQTRTRTATAQRQTAASTPQQATTRHTTDVGSSDRCMFETVSGIGATTATMRVSTGKAYSGTEMKFKAEAENVKTGERVFAKLYGIPTSDGRVQLTMEDLQPNTAYRIKVKMLVGGTYLFCPTVRTTTTSAQ